MRRLTNRLFRAAALVAAIQLGAIVQAGPPAAYQGADPVATDTFRAATPYNATVVGRPAPNPALNHPNFILCCDIPNQNLDKFVAGDCWGNRCCGGGFGRSCGNDWGGGGDCGRGCGRDWNFGGKCGRACGNDFKCGGDCNSGCGGSCRALFTRPNFGCGNKRGNDCGNDCGRDRWQRFSIGCNSGCKSSCGCGNDRFRRNDCGCDSGCGKSCCALFQRFNFGRDNGCCEKSSCGSCGTCNSGNGCSGNGCQGTPPVAPVPPTPPAPPAAPMPPAKPSAMNEIESDIQPIGHWIRKEMDPAPVPACEACPVHGRAPWFRLPTGANLGCTGCSTWKSEAVFIFGSCKQFFGEPTHNWMHVRQ